MKSTCTDHQDNRCQPCRIDWMRAAATELRIEAEYGGITTVDEAVQHLLTLADGIESGEIL